MSEISEISDLMASNDPMGTPVMALGPPPPVNTTPQIQGENTSQLHEQQIAMTHQNIEEPIVHKKSRNSHSKLTLEQRIAIVVSCCVFIILIPNVQQLLVNQFPVIVSNATLHVTVNAILVGLLFYFLKDQMLELF